MKTVSRLISLALVLALLLCCAQSAFAFAAVRSAQNLTVNGVSVSCDKYNIDGSNYFKLRDLAQLLNGTEGQFDVGWDDISKVVSVTTKHPYTTPNGHDLEIGADLSATAQPSAQTIMIDGAVRTDLTVYNIGGSNFFQLRELGKALGFLVDYIPETNTATVTSTPLIGTAPAMELTLKYSAGGKTNPTYFEEKAFGNAVCGDVDGDGKPEIVYGIRSIFCIDAASGSLKWRIPTGHDVTENLNPVDYAMGEAFTYIPFQILDYDGDGQQEIFTVTNIAGTTRCNIAVYDGTGRYKAHWTTEKRVWAACVEDFDGDGRCEVAIGFGNTTPEYNQRVHTIYLYNNDGSVRWSNFCDYGMFSDSMAAVDLDGDGGKELVLLCDDKYVVAYHADGSDVTADAFGGKAWREIPFYEGVDEKQPYESRETSIGLMGTHSGILADDLDGDGKQEIVCTGMFVLMGVVENNMANNAGVSFDDSAQYFSTFILNTDRTRYQNAAKGYDWSVIPRDLGEIVALDNPVIDHPSLRPTAADLDGDGEKEILFGSYDGKVHCFRLDGTEHGLWPFALEESVMRFASQPVAADVNGDGKQEVIFVTYTQRDQTVERGKLYVLDYSGRVLAETLLPVMFAYNEDLYYPNGSQTAPCVADVDGDGQPEIAVATYSCGVCVYELS